MGIDTHRHVGPYLRLRVPMRDSFRPVNGMCCGGRREPGFCPRCGKAVVAEQKPVKEELVDTYEISQSIDERLTDLSDCCGQVDDGFHYWMENGRSIGSLDANKPGAQELTDKAIRSAVNSFRVEFATEIATIEKAYGCAGEVKYGLLVWSS